MKHHFFSSFFWRFDRTFGNTRKWALQILYVLAILVVVTCAFAIVGSFVKQGAHPSGIGKHDVDYNIFFQTISMIFNASNLPPAEGMQTVPVWWQVLVVLVGAVVFTGFTITFVSNFLNNRIEAYRDGSVRYFFSDHILFLGGSKMIPPMIRELYKNPNHRKKHFVILTNEEPQVIRRHIDGVLSLEEKKALKITVLRGYRDDKETLQSVHLDKAARIYIIGDNPFDAEHDSANMASWNLAKQLCGHRQNVPCFLLFSRASSTFLFRHRSKETNRCLDTTVINRLESVSQRVLVHNGNEDKLYPPLDREGIDKDSERTVHFVLYGMTAVSYAMATTAAHLCHFPNFVTHTVNGKYGENKNKRTKITLIAPNIKEEMSYLITHLDSLFSISKCTIYDSNWKFGDDPKPIENEATLKDVGDFLDIEWEFIEGNIADRKIRQLLKQYYRDNQEGKTYFTLALCQREADKNIAAAIYLPPEFHEIVMKEGDENEIDYEKTIPVLVYQPESEEMLKTSGEEIEMFHNILPFGSVRESYDPSIRHRIMEGKRINYIYDQGKDYEFMTADSTKLDVLWRDLSYAEQMSNIYCASHIGVKLRSMGSRKDLSEEEMNLLAAVEHNRWNVEKLLMGFEALPKSERDKQHNDEGKKELDAAKMKFKHYGIAPYEELNERNKDCDILIIKNLRDVVGNEN